MLQKIIPNRRLRRLLIGIVIAVVAYTVIGFLAVPLLARWILTDSMTKSLHRSVSIDHIKFNPYTLTVDVQGFSIKDRDGAEVFVSLEGLHVDVRWGSIFQRALVVKALTFQSPYLKVVRGEDKLFNFSDLMQGGEQTPPQKADSAPPQKANSRPPRFILEDLRIANGQVVFQDRPYGKEHKIAGIELRLPLLTSLPDRKNEPARPEISLRFNEASLSIRAEIKPFSEAEETSVDVEIRGAVIPPYLAYAPMRMNLQLLSGSFEAKIRLSYSKAADDKARIGLTGDIALRSLEANDRAGKPLFKLPSLEVSIAGVDPMAQKVHLSKIAIQSPEVHVERGETGILNLQTLFPRETPGEPPKSGDQGSTPFVLAVDEIRLADGKISFSDLTVKGPFQTTLGAVELTVNRFTTEPNQKASVSVSAKTETDEALKVSGEFSLTPMWSEGTLELGALLLKKYAPYYAEQVLFDIEDGKLDLTASYRFSGAQPTPDVNAVLSTVSLNSLRLRQREEKEEFLNIGNLSVKNAELDPGKREIRVAEVSTKQGSLVATRFKNGEISLQKLVPPPAPTSAGAAPPADAPAPAPSGGGGAQELPWVVNVARVVLEDYGFKLTDETIKQPATITADQMKLSVENISTAKNTKSKLNLSAVLNKKGSISVEGEMSMDPLAGDLRVDVKGLDFAPFEPYMPDNVRIKVGSGDVSTKGQVTVGQSAKGELTLKYKGDVASSNFASRDKPSGEDFLKWKALQVKAIDFTLSPMRVDIREVALQDFYSRIIIKPDRTLNVQDVVASGQPGTAGTPESLSQKQPAPTSPSKGGPAPIRIGKVLLKGGQINLSDRSIQPNVTFNMLDIEGTLSELTSDETKLSDVNLTGKLEHQSPLEITGKINPFREDLFVELKIRFKDIDLVRMNPYSQKYVGYKIQKGKLFLDLDYLIVQKKLESQNRVLLDQLTLGEKVESPDAPDLPIKLAVAILKNRQGQILLELPVTGDIDDPQFSLAGLVGDAIMKLLTKIITAPFALLGDLFGGGGGEENYVEFDYGSTAVSKQNEEKLGNLVKALHERPGLELELEGRVDPEKDGPEIKRAAVLDLIKKQKLSEMEKKKQPLPPIQDLQIEPAEREKFLRMAYDAEKNPDAKKESTSIVSKVGSLVPFLRKDDSSGYPPPPEMEQFLMGRVQLSDEDLRAFALRRATAIKDMMLVSGLVDAEKIFLTEPDLSGKGDGDKKSGVLLRLK